MNHVAVITGAGSGVGRAVALALAKQNWKIALVGRRAEALHETAQMARSFHSEDGLICPCDIGDLAAVATMAESVLKKFGAVEALVNAAGTNVPQRSLEVLSMEDYRRMLDTNLNGAYYCVQAFLPAMRQRQSGTIVNIISDAGIQASAKSGPAYVISKFGLRGLTSPSMPKNEAMASAPPQFSRATLTHRCWIDAPRHRPRRRARRCFILKIWRNAPCSRSPCPRGRFWRSCLSGPGRSRKPDHRSIHSS